MAECIADVDCSLEMAKDRLLAEMAKGITPTNQLNGPQNRAEFHAGMYISGHINAVSGSFTGEINATSGKFSGVIEAREFVGDICGSKVMQGVSIRATNDERSTSTRYTDSATYQIGKTITVMANCERNGGSGAITVTININGQVKTAEVMPYTAGIPAMYQTVVFSVYTTSPVVDISVSLRVRGQYTTSASVWPLVMVSRSGNNFTN